MQISLDTVLDVPTQALFDHCVSHLLTQKIPSIKRTPGTGTVCWYRLNLEGGVALKCVAGACISDEEYGPEFEGRNIQALIRENRAKRGLEMVELGSQESKNVDLLGCLQSIHDLTYPAEWVSKLMKLACDFQLEWNFGVRPIGGLA